MAVDGPSPGGRLVSLQIGTPRAATTGAGRVWESAIFKEPVPGRVFLGRTNLRGDAQANRRYHGGPDKAVCCYCAEHYPEWREVLRVALPYGAFGENFTTAGLTEAVTCVGDVFRVGDAAVQVTQPRQPCVNLSRRWERPDLPRRMEENGRTGHYLRVLTEGEVGAGDVLTLVERPHPGWTLLRANRLMYGNAADPAEIAALRELTSLSTEWKRILGRKRAKTA